jgi:hypothetical protein
MFGLSASVSLAQTPATPAAPAAPAAQTTTTAQPPAAGQPAPAAAPAPAGPAPGSVAITGLVDIYYEVNTRAPSNGHGGAFTSYAVEGGEAIKVDNAGRSFDINSDAISLSLGEVNIVRTADKSFPFGITATLTGGDTARLVHANEPGGTGWQYVQQLYITRSTQAGKTPIAVDAGIWVTPFGYEVIESSSNDNYTRSFGFQYSIPLYHAGIRATATISPTLTGMAAIVNGWNDIADDNNGKSAMGQLTWKPNAKFTGIATFMGGPEGTGAYGPGIPTNGGGSIGTSLGEFQPTYQMTDKLKFAGDLVVARAAGTVLGNQISGSWVSMAGYTKYQINKKWAFAARLEQFEDIPGVGDVGLRTGLPGYTKLDEVTLTLEYLSFKGHLVSRLEYRHDHSSQGFFGTGDGAAAQDQDTFVLGEVYKF